MTSQHDRQLMNLVDEFLSGSISRRQLVRRMSALGGVAVFGGSIATILAACGGSDSDDSTAESGGAASTAGAAGSTPGSAASTADAAASSASPASSAPAPKQGGTIVAATVDKPVNMDPAFAELYSSMQVYQNIFNKLVYVDAKNSIIPGLAKSWNQIDETTWEFELVDNAVFHNDEPFTSRDVAYTFKRLFDPKLAAPNTVFFPSFDTCEPQGDYKVTIKLKHSDGSFLASLASALEIVNEKAINAADTRLHPVGTGPFKFVEWVKDDHITLERWEKYHVKGRPYADKVIFRAIADDTVRLTGLQTNELQWIQQVPLQQADELAKSDEVKATDGQPFLPDMIYLNCGAPPFDDKRVRQAIAWCVDRDEIVKVAFNGQAVAQVESIPDSNPYYSGINVWKDGPDYDKAKQLLKDAGTEGLKFTFDGQPQVPTQLKAAQVLKQQLAKAGIEMTIQNYESGEWIQRLLSKEYQSTISYWSATVDPGHFYYTNLYSSSPWNSSGYGTPELDKALDTFMSETDLQKRKDAYKAVVQLIQDDVPLITIESWLVRYWVRPNVYGAEPLPSLEVRMEPVYIEEDEA